MSPKLKPGFKRLDVYLREDDERRFREEVFKRKGMKKGNLSEAASEAIQVWCRSGVVSDTPKRKSKRG